MNLRITLSTLLLALFTISSMGQAKKPTLMVVPSDAWCHKHGYMQEFDNQGTIEQIPDYKAALMDDNLNAVISKINILMADYGFPLKDLQQTLKSISRNTTAERLITSKNTNASIAEKDIDRFLRIAKADITLEISWTVNKVGPKSSVTYNLRALDAYSNKQVAGAEGTSKGSFSVEVPVLLEEAVQDHMDMFVQRLQSHFDDLFENGREVVLDMKVFEGSEFDFESEFDGYLLSEIIDNWLAENCVNHVFSKLDATERMLLYEQVRIPLYKANGMAQDTEGFARELARYLRKPPYNIPVKIIARGLGSCILIIGDK